MQAWGRFSRRLAAAVSVAMLPLACTSTGTPPPPAHPTVSSVEESANGTTVHIAIGSVVRVTLHSTYWHFAADATPAVLRRAGVITRSESAGPRIPGSGRGTVMATFAAISAGSAIIRAMRSSCGEALRCLDGQGSYRVTVVVR